MDNIHVAGAFIHFTRPYHLLVVEILIDEAIRCPHMVILHNATIDRVVLIDVHRFLFS